MGTVSQFHDRTRPLAHRIESEEEAVATARRLAAAYAPHASERDISRILPYAELDDLSQSGLTAITVPHEHQGLDVANALLGEIVAIIAEADPSIAECLSSHFQALERIRAEKDEALKAILFASALNGDRFAAADFAGTTGISDADGTGYRLNGKSLPSPGILFANWIVARTSIDTAGKPIVLYLGSDTPGLQIFDDWDGFGQRTNGTASLVASNARIDASLAVPSPATNRSIADALAALLHAATDLGIARAALSHLRDAPSSASIGKLAIGVAAAAALIESAGHKLDFAQVNPSTGSLGSALFAASAASVTTNAIALETATALFELSSSDSASIGLNLDRHWRNARIRRLGTASDDIHRQAAEHYFGKNL